jgi:iron complex transport system ATP-binding protein
MTALATGSVALRARDLGWRLGDRWLLRGVNLGLNRGRVLAVIGPNGAGKSSLLSLLAGDARPTEGGVWLEGGPLGSNPSTHSVDRLGALELARRRAVLIQRPTLSFPFTVGEVVAMGRAPWAGTDEEDCDEAVIAEAMTASGVEGLATRRFPSLSGGEQALTSFARVLAQQADVLLLDEPTAALDLRHQETLMRTAQNAAEDGKAVLVVLHDIQLAAAYADEIAVLRAGRLVAHGDPGTVLTAPLLSEVYQLPIDVFHHPRHGGLMVTPRRDHPSRERKEQL